MDLTTALLNLRDRLDEPAPGVWTDAQLTRAINEGIRQVTRRTESVRAVEEITTTAEVADYDQPANIVRLHRCEWVPDGQNQTYPLDYKDYDALDKYWGTWRDNVGYPNFWTTWQSPPNLYIKLWPVPAVDGILRVFFYAFGAPVASGGDTIDVPDGWEDLTIDYAEYRAWCQARRPEMAAMALQMWQDNLGALVEAGIRYTDQPGEFNPPNMDGFAGSLYGEGWI